MACELVRTMKGEREVNLEQKKFELGVFGPNKKARTLTRVFKGSGKAFQKRITELNFFEAFNKDLVLLEELLRK